MTMSERSRIWVRQLKNGLKRLSLKPVMLYGYRRFDGTFLHHTRVSSAAHIGDGKNFMVGDHVYIGPFNFIDTFRKVTIGEGCQVTGFVSILTHSSHRAIRLYGRAYVEEKDLGEYGDGEVTIGPYTFVGPFSVIMPGTRIGKGCVVSAHSYVRGDVPDFAVVRGAPAAVVGDTRDGDRAVLAGRPDLAAYYRAWQSGDDGEK